MRAPPEGRRRQGAPSPLRATSPSPLRPPPPPIETSFATQRLQQRYQRHEVHRQRGTGPPLLSPSISELPVVPGSTVRFMSRKCTNMGMPSPLEAHALDVESPSATLQRKKEGGGIVYHPPENLAEFLDSGIVPPVSGETPRGVRGVNEKESRRGFFDAEEKSGAEDVGLNPGALKDTVTSELEIAMFYCAFCMQNRAGADRRRFEGNGGCSHEFCKECLDNYLFQRIRVGHHSLHPCPKVGEEGCQASASVEDVRGIVSPMLFEEHRKRFEGLSGPCEACGARGRRPSSPSPLVSPRAHNHSAALNNHDRASNDHDDHRNHHHDHPCWSCGTSPPRGGRLASPRSSILLMGAAAGRLGSPRSSFLLGGSGGGGGGPAGGGRRGSTSLISIPAAPPDVSSDAGSGSPPGSVASSPGGREGRRREARRMSAAAAAALPGGEALITAAGTREGTPVGMSIDAADPTASEGVDIRGIPVGPARPRSPRAVAGGTSVASGAKATAVTNARVTAERRKRREDGPRPLPLIASSSSPSSLSRVKTYFLCCSR